MYPLCKSNYKQCDCLRWNRSLAPKPVVHDISINICKQIVSYVIRKNGKKGIYFALNRLHEQGFTTWMTKVLDLANDYNLDLKQNRHHFEYECKMVVIDRFTSNWHNNLINTEINPGLRTYQTIKKSFRPEPYLYLVREARFRNAIAQIRASSHTLAIERGRYTRPKTPIKERLCKSWAAFYTVLSYKPKP